MRAKVKVPLFSIFLVTFFFPGTAYSYVDPGTGSYILQILLASLMGAIFYFKQIRLRIKSFFLGLFSKKQDR